MFMKANKKIEKTSVSSDDEVSVLHHLIALESIHLIVLPFPSSRAISPA